jgi:hypothetical protein
MTWALFFQVLALVFLFLAAIKCPEKWFAWGWAGLFIFHAASLLR